LAKKQDQDAESISAFGWERANHPWADTASAIAKPFAVFSTRTRFVSWLESALSGTHPRTKGTRCFACGFRHRIPL